MTDDEKYESHGNSSQLKSLGNAKTKYPTTPDEAELEKIPWKGEGFSYVTWECPEYTCACPKTGQPDFATVYIQYIPEAYIVESKSLKIYLFSFRNYGHFHEVGIERIAKDIFDFIQPKFLRVVGDFNKRGGISIVPISEFGDLSLSSSIPIPKITYGS